MDPHPFATPLYNPYLFASIVFGWTAVLAAFGAKKVFWDDYSGPEEK